MRTNTDITIYNLAHKGTRNESWQRTLISGVNWHGAQKVAVTDNGLISEDTYTVRIPLESAPVEREYIHPDEYALLTQEALAASWTLQNGDLIVRGTGPTIEKPADITRRAECFMVTGWSDNRRGSKAMQHWKVEGK